MSLDPATALPGFAMFAADLRRRLEAGAQEYGDRSFSRDPDELLREIDEEILDIAGWAYVLRVRLGRLRQARRDAGAGGASE